MSAGVKSSWSFSDGECRGDLPMLILGLCYVCVFFGCRSPSPLLWSGEGPSRPMGSNKPPGWSLQDLQEQDRELLQLPPAQLSGKSWEGEILGWEDLLASTSTKNDERHTNTQTSREPGGGQPDPPTPNTENLSLTPGRRQTALAFAFKGARSSGRVGEGMDDSTSFQVRRPYTTPRGRAIWVIFTPPPSQHPDSY